MRIQIATAQVPFCPNPIDALAEDLKTAVRQAGHAAEVVRIPYRGQPLEHAPDELAALRLLAFGEGPDELLIALEFPVSLVAHPRKVLWLARCESPPDPVTCGDSDRGMNEDAPGLRRHVARCVWAEARGVYSVSATLSYRWRKLSGLDVVPLYPPPRPAGCFESGPPEDYILVPLTPAGDNRPERILEALARTRQPVAVRFLGAAGQTASVRERVAERAAGLKLDGRWQWLDAALEATQPYARCRAVLAVPLAETSPEVALLAMRAGKPLITGLDSGAPAELVTHRRTGWVVSTEPAVLAWTLDDAWSRPRWTRDLGQAARKRYQSMDLDWSRVVERLLA